MGGMFGSMCNQIMVLIAQFSGPPATPSRVWPNPFLLVVGSAILMAPRLFGPAIAASILSGMACDNK
jgi:hypothetical protein